MMYVWWDTVHQLYFSKKRKMWQDVLYTFTHAHIHLCEKEWLSTIIHGCDPYDSPPGLFISKSFTLSNLKFPDHWPHTMWCHQPPPWTYQQCWPLWSWVCEVDVGSIQGGWTHYGSRLRYWRRKREGNQGGWGIWEPIWGQLDMNQKTNWWEVLHYPLGPLCTWDWVADIFLYGKGLYLHAPPEIWRHWCRYRYIPSLGFQIKV